MTRTNEPASRPAPPSVADLFLHTLQRQVDAHASGLGYAEPAGDAYPHDAVPVQPVDPALAWQDALAAARILSAAGETSWAAPPEWPALVAQQEPAAALAFCLGNYPQRVRDLHPLLTREPAALRDGPAPPAHLPALLGWAGQEHAGFERLVAAAVLRLARQFDRAGQLLARPSGEPWQAVHANEVAALAWDRGDAEHALALWQQAPDNACVLFNRGMAALFLGRPAPAAGDLARAAAALPERSAWHHLAQLYLALARARA
jgi:tetratricopeptide (TPR) repeat protein